MKILETQNKKNAKVCSKLAQYYKDDNFCRANENYYSCFYEDLSNIKNLKDKDKNYLSSKNRFYRFTAYYYNYIFFKEHLFELDK